VYKSQVYDNINEALSALTSFAPDFSDFGERFRMNSGFTKIYALLSPDTFIIYDSRVAAALAHLIVLFCQKQGLTEIPVLLQKIKLMEAQGEACRIVAVANTKLSFLNLNSNQRNHAISNVFANWLVSEAYKLAKESKNNKFINLREVEAALFMLGYDFPQYSVPKDIVGNVKIKGANKRKGSSKVTSIRDSKETNHDKIFNHVIASPLGLHMRFNYRNIHEIAKEILPDVTSSGQAYASLRFIQLKCLIINDDFDGDFRRTRDPRNFAKLNELKEQYQFELIQSMR
jgi:hypothetical protein